MKFIIKFLNNNHFLSEECVSFFDYKIVLLKTY